jgi:hypothetical protein
MSASGERFNRRGRSRSPRPRRRVPVVPNRGGRVYSVIRTCASTFSVPRRFVRPACRDGQRSDRISRGLVGLRAKSARRLGSGRQARAHWYGCLTGGPAWSPGAQDAGESAAPGVGAEATVGSAGGVCRFRSGVRARLWLAPPGWRHGVEAGGPDARAMTTRVRKRPTRLAAAPAIERLPPSASVSRPL